MEFGYPHIPVTCEILQHRCFGHFRIYTLFRNLQVRSHFGSSAWSPSWHKSSVPGCGGGAWPRDGGVVWRVAALRVGRPRLPRSGHWTLRWKQRPPSCRPPPPRTRPRPQRSRSQRRAAARGSARRGGSRRRRRTTAARRTCPRRSAKSPETQGANHMLSEKVCMEEKV